MPAKDAAPTTDLRRVPLLREDPDLAAAIPPAELPLAERAVVVGGFAAAVGPLELPADGAGTSLGLLVLDGLVTVNVTLVDRVASLLAGPGDVIDLETPPDALVPALVEHHVSTTAQIAILDERFVTAMRRWPGLMLVLHERLRSQERRLEVHAAIGKLRRVEDRVLAVLWHLAERWGRMTAEGVVVPLALTHETLGRLAGAERPTVSLALSELTDADRVTRRPDGSFLLRETSLNLLVPDRESHPQARQLSARVAVADVPGPPVRGARLPRAADEIDRDQLLERAAAARGSMPARVAVTHDVIVRARAATRRSAALRALLADQRADT